MIETGRFLQQRYRIDKQIGQGGMGAVYVATDERFGSTVAIKETLCMDDNFRKAIEREARLLNSLKHSALPRVSDHFEEDNGQFLVMEYIAGDDVGSMLDVTHERVPVETVLKWADQLLDALDYLHTQNIPIVHRDIKPQNLKINPKGDVILLDFGLAKGNPTDASHQTAAKSIFGYSRNYASLEQIQGTGTDPRSDLYSLAATLYHLLTATPPEDALTRAMAVLSQKPDPLCPANDVDPKVPRGVAGVLQRAMALNADERPASALAMREMLRHSEDYGYLADSVTMAAAPTQAFAVDTKLMPESTKVEGTKSTEAKTEILPGNPSEMTAVRPGAIGRQQTRAFAGGMTTAPPKRSRGLTAAVSALILLIAGCAVAGGLYVYKPSLFGRTVANTEQPLQPIANQAEPANLASEAALTNTANTAETTQRANTPSEQSKTKDLETTKGNKTATDKSTTDESTTDESSPYPDVEVKNVPGGIDIIKKENGKTTVTHVDTLPKNFQPMPPEAVRALRNLDPRNLTPEQRKRFQRYLRNHPNGNQQPPQPPNEK